MAPSNSISTNMTVLSYSFFCFIEIYNSENVQEIRENLDDMKEKYEHKKEEIKSKHKDDLDELKAKYDNLVKETHIFQKRIIKAFPNLTSRRYEEQLAKLKYLKTSRAMSLITR